MNGACQTLCYIAKGHETWSVLHVISLCLVFVLLVYFDCVRYSMLHLAFFKYENVVPPKNRCDITPLPPQWTPLAVFISPQGSHCREDWKDHLEFQFSIQKRSLCFFFSNISLSIYNHVYLVCGLIGQGPACWTTPTIV